MKYICLIIVLLTLVNSVHGQNSTDTTIPPYALPGEVSFHIPISVRDSVIIHNGSKGTDQIYVVPLNTSIDGMFFLQQNDRSVQTFQINDTIFLIKIDGDSSMVCRFSLDTLNSTLQHFTISYTINGGKGGFPISEFYTFTIDSLPYRISLDHHLIASENGPRIYRRLAKVDYYYSDIQGNSFIVQRNIFKYDKLSVDSESCSISIDLKTTDPKFSVKLLDQTSFDITIFLENNSLFIRTENLFGLTTASLYSIDGRLLSRTKLDISAAGIYTLDVSDLHTRFALLVLQTEKGVITRKIILSEP